ncbi:TnsD family Tn7-like transposition protein [Brevibacillus fluminis]|uniref:TnsD family Tn7-like transposition protein n=1 Tax=Brevibacillus fluminis TaxID=511487 RepID=UPI001605803E|nr:TnsD family Tn7-like transposition protein [Brevibacillus fluminis]
MLTYFPTPYRDELLYSVLARYHVRAGNISPKVTMSELFGKSSTRSSVDFQANLTALVKRLPIGSVYTEDEFIRNHSLLPLYLPFLDQKKSQKAISLVMGEDGRGIRALVGVTASSVSAITSLQFCGDCFIQDREQYGEAYWHRIHQVSGVLVCPEHGSRLLKSNRLLQDVNQHEFIQADDENIEMCTYVIDDSIDTRVLQRVANEMRWLLNASLTPFHENYLRQQYTKVLQSKGLALPSGRVRKKELIKAFCDIFPQDILQLLQSEIDETSDQTWLSAIVRKHRRAFHPIRHVLMMSFLCGSTEDFFTGKGIKEPFGNGPWKCFNPVVNHFEQEVVHAKEITYCYDSKKVVGQFTCSCGFSYSVREKIGKEIQRKDIKILCYGEVWEQKLKTLIQERATLEVMSTALRADTETLKKQAIKLGIAGKWKLLKGRKNQLIENFPKEESGTEYQDKWLQLLIDFPDDGINKLRLRAPHIYAWLYRCRKEWLKENSPKEKGKIQLRARVDWNQRDEMLLSLLHEILTKWDESEADKLLQKTFKSITRKTGKQSWFEKVPQKIPRSVEYVSTVVESKDEFQIRRVKRVISRLGTEFDVVREWQVYRLSGINSKLASSRVKKFIEIALENQTMI